MKIIHYSDPFARKTPFGTGRYALELHKALKRIDSSIQLQPVSTWTDRDAAGLAELEQNYGFQKLPWMRKLTASSWAFLKYPPIEHWVGKKFDLLHLLETVYPVQTNKTLVATVHDLGPLLHPELFTSVRPWLMKMGLKHIIHKAAAIICVSQATADDLGNYFKVDLADRLQVIHEGASPLFFEQADLRVLNEIDDLPPQGVPFVMTMGAISPRKNLGRVIDALESIQDQVPHHLVHIGIAHWDARAFFEKVKASTLGERIHLPGYLNDAQIHALYTKASAYVFPSLFEGFGLPLLEAMAAGCPIITSNISSMPEIAADAAVLIDPFDVHSIADGLLEVCQNETLATQLVETGKRRVQAFSWDTCAQKTYEIYQKII